MPRPTLNRPVALSLLVSCLAVWPSAPVPDDRLVRLIATDLKFSAPSEVQAGFTAIRLVNQGQVWHEALVVRLDGDATVDSYLAAARANEDFPAGAVDLGGPGLVATGDSSEVLLDLTPGRYALVCWADNHVKAGMILPLTVTEARNPSIPVPPADVDVALKDFSFELSLPLRAGRQVIKLTNTGARAHEFVVYKFEEGRTIEDFAACFASREGAPPAWPVGGATSMVPGREVWVSLALEPGRYFVVCGVPEGDKIHAQLGMLQEFEIQ